MAAPNAALALVVVLGLAAVTAPSAQAKTLIVLFSLDPHDGAGPRGELIQVPMETCTGQPYTARSTAKGLSSNSPKAAP